MNRKYNPYVSLWALLLLALIMVFTCTGCVKASAATPARFTTYEQLIDASTRVYVFTDTETEAQYMFVDGSRCGGLCKLED